MGAFDFDRLLSEGPTPGEKSSSGEGCGGGVGSCCRALPDNALVIKVGGFGDTAFLPNDDSFSPVLKLKDGVRGDARGDARDMILGGVETAQSLAISLKSMLSVV